MSKKALIIGLVIVLLIIGLSGRFIWRWVICYQWCEPGESLGISKKTGDEGEKNKYAAEDESGVLEQMKGPGRYLDFDPWNYDVTPVKDIKVPVGYFYLLNNKFIT